MKLTQDIAWLIRRHDELETRVGEVEKAAKSAGRTHPLLPAMRSQLHGVQARLAAQGFFMSIGKAGVGE